LRPGVEPPCTCSPSTPTQAPSKGSSVQWRRSIIPVNRRGAQHAPVVRPPFTFGRILQPGFEFSPRACARPRAAAMEDEGFGLPGVLVMLSTLSYSSQILAYTVRGRLSSPTSKLTCQVPPTFSCCAQRQSKWSQCRLRSRLLTWHLSASTADSLLKDFPLCLVSPPSQEMECQEFAVISPPAKEMARDVFAIVFSLSTCPRNGEGSVCCCV
jgi:hypothetical protein